MASKKITTQKTAAVKAAPAKAAQKKATPAKVEKPKVEKVSTQLTEQVEASRVEQMEQSETVAETTAEAKIEAAETAPATFTKAEKPVRPTSERYEAACTAVSHINAKFLETLGTKARLLGHDGRKNESVGVYSHPDITKLNKQIAKLRGQLDALLKEKRALKVQSPELAEVDERLKYLRKQRNLARQEKKAALAEIS